MDSKEEKETLPLVSQCFPSLHWSQTASAQDGVADRLFWFHPEIGRFIFSLCGIHALPRLSLVCRRWCMEAKKGFRVLDVRKFRQNLEDDDLLHLLNQRCNFNLEAVNLSGCTRLTEVSMTELCRRNPGIQILHLTGCSVVNHCLMPLSSSLIALNVEFVPGSMYPCFMLHLLLKSFTALEKLSFTDTAAIHHPHPFFQGCNKLKHIRCSGSRICATMFKDMEMSTMETVTLNGCYIKDFKALGHLLRKAPLLKKVTLLDPLQYDYFALAEPEPNVGELIQILRERGVEVVVGYISQNDSPKPSKIREFILNRTIDATYGQYLTQFMDFDTLLNIFIRAGFGIPEVKMLLELGAQPSLPTSRPPIVSALSNKNLEMVKLFLNYGADPLDLFVHGRKKVTQDVLNMILETCTLSFYQWAQLFVELDNVPKLCTLDNLRAVFNAVPAGPRKQHHTDEILRHFLELPSKPLILRFLLENGADLNFLHEDDQRVIVPAFWVAANTPNEETIRLIAEYRPNWDFQDSEQKSTFLHLIPSLSELHVESHVLINIFEVIASSGANFNLQDKHGWTPLHLTCAWAEEEKSSPLIISLIACGADTNIHDAEGMTPIDHLSGEFAELFELAKAQPEPQRSRILASLQMERRPLIPQPVVSSPLSDS